MACRVAALEKDVVKLQGMWDINKGQRVIEAWMSLLNKKSYKPLDWWVHLRSYLPTVLSCDGRSL